MGRLSTTECTYLPTYLPTLSNQLVWYRIGLRCSAARTTLNNVVMTMRL